MIENFGLFHGGSLRRHLWCLLLSISVFCFLTPDVNAHGGSSGSGGSSSGSGASGGSGSSGSSGSGSGGHGGHGGSMGGNSAGPGNFTASGPASSGTGHGGTGHGGTGHGSGHASASTSIHGTAVAHSTSMAAAKNSGTRNQALRNDFTSDRTLHRSSDRIRNRQITSTGGFVPETYRKKKLKTNNALATKNAAQNSAAR